MQQIAFLQTIHKLYDDRVFYHQTKSLEKYVFNVTIISAYEKNEVDIIESEDNNNTRLIGFDSSKYKLLDLIRKLKEKLSLVNPDIIICDNPVSVFAANRYRVDKKLKNCVIVQDITEFYPSKKNLFGLDGFEKFIKKGLLTFADIIGGDYSDAFIFGEYYKSIAYRKRQKNKRYVFVPYYPKLEYIKAAPEKTDFNKWVLSYSGKLTEEKGYIRALKAVKQIAKIHPNIQFIFNVISQDVQKEYSKDVFENLTINFMFFKPFKEYCEFLHQNDLFLDLRDNDEENTQCLPIKLFYYLAAARPSIFSNLDAINHEIKDFSLIGKLVDPNNLSEIVKEISFIISNPDYYKKTCTNAKKLSENKFNWNIIEDDFINFIKSL